MIGWRYLLRHPWQSVLMIVGIALGVSVVVSVDIANASTSKAFNLSKEAMVGRATHQIIGGPQGVNETIYTTIKLMDIKPNAAPVVMDIFTSPELGGRPLQLLGIDPFTENAFRGFLGVNNFPSVNQLLVFLTKPGGVLISRQMAEEYDVSIGMSLSLEIGGYQRRAFVAGLLDPADNLTRRALDGIILADIATAQELTGRVGILDKIDLILPIDSNNSIKEIQKILPRGYRIVPASMQGSSLEQMTAAFRLNLLALSLLALLVGMFLIFNTMTFSVVQRRSLFGTLRCLGVTRSELFLMILGEAAIAGMIGCILGIGLGILMGSQTIAMVSQTINDLYYTSTIQSVGIPVESLVKGGILGIFTTIGAAMIPAWEATTSPIRITLLRSGLERKTRRVVNWVSLTGLAMILIGLGIFLLPLRDLYSGFGGSFAIVVGFVMMTSFFMVGLLRLAAPLLDKIFGFLGRLAPLNLINSLSRTAVAVTALTLAVAVTIGMNLMIESFRYTVAIWLNETLNGDIYLSAPTFNAGTPLIPMDSGIISQLEKWRGVDQVLILRSITLDSPWEEINVNASNNPNLGAERLFQYKKHKEPQAIQTAMVGGSVLMSESLARRLDLLKPNSSIVLNTPAGRKSFPIEGIIYDYTSSEGSIWMWRPIYQQIWDDDSITAIDLRLIPGVDPEKVVRDMQETLHSDQRLIIRSNRALRQDVMEVFDRTFAITNALRLLATVVAFIGVLNSLLLLQIEKQRELGILRTLGLTGRQLWQLVMLETGLMGTVAGLLSLPAGVVLTYILIYIINRRSFGWTLQMNLEPWAFLQAMMIAVSAGFLAGLYPANKYLHMTAAEAVRYE
jgi:putative ABC transport system permease protein